MEPSINADKILRDVIPKLTHANDGLIFTKLNSIYKVRETSNMWVRQVLINNMSNWYQIKQLEMEASLRYFNRFQAVTPIYIRCNRKNTSWAEAKVQAHDELWKNTGILWWGRGVQQGVERVKCHCISKSCLSLVRHIFLHLRLAWILPPPPPQTTYNPHLPEYNRGGLR